MIRVQALVPYPVGRAPGQRYRIEQWTTLLRREGVHVNLLPFLSRRGMDVLYEPGQVLVKTCETLRAYLGRLVSMLQCCSADVIFVYREAALLGPAWIEWLLSQRRPIVFDFDDAIYLRDTSSANAWSRRLKAPSKTANICRLARHVIVGNDFLARFAKDHANNVTVIPSTIDTDLYSVRRRSPNRVPIIGWTGTMTTLPHLIGLAPALRKLRKKREFELHVIGVKVDIEGLPVECHPWRAETEPDDLRPADIGLMPLPDDDWSRGKCGMKALQYMALGIPPVVSPVGVNATIVRDGVNGLYASTEEEWIDRLANLLDNERLRGTLGQEARRTIEQSYSARTHAPRVARIFAEATA